MLGDDDLWNNQLQKLENLNEALNVLLSAATYINWLHPKDPDLKDPLLYPLLRKLLDNNVLWGQQEQANNMLLTRAKTLHNLAYNSVYLNIHEYLSLKDQARAHALNHLRSLVYQVNKLLPQGDAALEAFNQALQDALNTTDLWSLEQLQILLNANNPLLNPYDTEKIRKHLRNDKQLWRNPIVRGDGTLWWNQQLHALLNDNNPNQLQLLKRVKAAAAGAVGGAHNLTAVNAPAEQMLNRLNQELYATLHDLWHLTDLCEEDDFMKGVYESLLRTAQERGLTQKPNDENGKGWLQNPATDKDEVLSLIEMLQRWRKRAQRLKQGPISQRLKKPLEQGLNLLWSLQRLQRLQVAAPPQQ